MNIGFLGYSNRLILNLLLLICMPFNEIFGIDAHATDLNAIARNSDSLLEQGKYKEAKCYLKKNLHFNDWTGDESNAGHLLNNFGIAYEYMGAYDSAFYYYEKALRVRKQKKDTLNMAKSIRNMAQILRVMNRFDEAVFYVREAFELIPGLNDYKVEANIYNEMAYLYELTGNLDSARYYYQQLIDVSDRNGYKMGVSVGISNLGNVLEREGKYQKSLDLKLRALNMDRRMLDVHGMMTSYRSIAGCYLLMTQDKMANLYIDSASHICDSSWLADREGIEALRYQVYKKSGQYDKSLYHFENYITLKDRIFSEQRRKNIAEILTKYETEKKEHEIEVLQNMNQLKTARIHAFWIIVAALLLLALAGVIISGLIIKNKNHRIREMSLEIRNYLLRLEQENKQENQNHHKSTSSLHLLINKFGLTSREAEIMTLIGEGLGNNEIAARLFVSNNTVKFHIKNTFLKLDVRNRVEALRKTDL